MKPASLRHALLLAMAFAAGSAFGQGADQTGPGQPNRSDEEKPKSFFENLEKLKIEKTKKDHELMIERGRLAMTISDDLERTIAMNGSLREGDYTKIAQVEKLVKKIREELGGNGDGDVDDPIAGESVESERIPSTEKGMIEALRARARSMFEQLKNTSRFTVSAPAIVATNAVLKVARFLKLKR